MLTLGWVKHCVCLSLIRNVIVSLIIQNLTLISGNRGKYKGSSFISSALGLALRLHPSCVRCLYLSRLLTGGLVLRLLTQLPDPLVFGKEVLLLIHVLAVRPLVHWLPAHEREQHSEGDVREIWTS